MVAQSRFCSTDPLSGEPRRGRFLSCFLFLEQFFKPRHHGRQLRAGGVAAGDAYDHTAAQQGSAADVRHCVVEKINKKCWYIAKYSLNEPREDSII